MKKIIAVVVFITFQCIALWILYIGNFKTHAEEVDMEIYEFENEGHEYMIFEENGRTISVIHNPDCECRLHDVK